MLVDCRRERFATVRAATPGWQGATRGDGDRSSQPSTIPETGDLCRGSGYMNTIETIEQTQLQDRPDLRPGLTVRVHVKIREGEKERIQVFEGVVIAIRRGGSRGTFTVRKVSFGQGVERIFPMHSPSIAKIEIGRAARVRRAKLYFLRNLRGRAARLREKRRPTS